MSRCDTRWYFDLIPVGHLGIVSAKEEAADCADGLNKWAVPNVRGGAYTLCNCMHNKLY